MKEILAELPYEGKVIFFVGLAATMALSAIMWPLNIQWIQQYKYEAEKAQISNELAIKMAELGYIQEPIDTHNPHFGLKWTKE